jgi:hypothetical protein
MQRAELAADHRAVASNKQRKIFFSFVVRVSTFEKRYVRAIIATLRLTTLLGHQQGAA